MCDQGADDRKVDAQLRLSETFALVKKKKKGGQGWRPTNPRPSSRLLQTDDGREFQESEVSFS